MNEARGENKDLVSVIIPLYNGARWIRETVESVLNQTYDDVELIVVDDGSTDDGPEMIKDYPLTLIRQPNRGIGGARNTGIRAARGEYIALLDQDDLLKPEKVRLQVEFLKAHPECVLVFTPEERFGEKETERRVSTRHLKRKHRGDVFTEIYQANFITPSSALIRRQVLESAGLFNEALAICEDHDLFIRIAYQGPVGFMDIPLVEYRWHGDNTSTLRAALLPGIELTLYRTYLPLLKQKAIWWWWIYNNKCAKSLRDMGIGEYRHARYREAAELLLSSWLHNPWRLKTLRFLAKSLLYRTVKA